MHHFIADEILRVYQTIWYVLEIGRNFQHFRLNDLFIFPIWQHCLDLREKSDLSKLVILFLSYFFQFDYYNMIFCLLFLISFKQKKRQNNNAFALYSERKEYLFDIKLLIWLSFLFCFQRRHKIFTSKIYEKVSALMKLRHKIAIQFVSFILLSYFVVFFVIAYIYIFIYHNLNLPWNAVVYPF